MMKKLQLNWASVDWIVTPKDEFYFLEINRPGSQYWLYPFAGIDTAKEVVIFLQKKLNQKL